MSPSHLVSGSAAERVRPYSFSRPETLKPAGPALAAIHLEAEVERRTREVTDAIREQARQAGFNEGANTARAEMESVIDVLRQAVDQAARSTDDTLDDLARSALVAGVAIAEAIVGKVVIDDPATLFDPIRQAIHSLDGDENVVLHLHPADHTTLRKALNRSDDPDVAATDLSALIKSIRIIEDQSIPRGTCRVESATRIAVDSLSQRLDEIRRVVEES